MTQPAASGPDQFDPATFTVVEPRTFEDLKVGDIFRAPSRTLTDAHATAFQAVSADNHPIHYNVEYARSHGHTAPVVHGLQVLAFTAPGRPCSRSTSATSSSPSPASRANSSPRSTPTTRSTRNWRSPIWPRAATSAR